MNRRIQQHVLLAGQLRMEAGAELDHAADPRAAATSSWPVVGRWMPATSLRNVLLPEPFLPMSATRFALGYSQGHAASAQNSSWRARAADRAGPAPAP